MNTLLLEDMTVSARWMTQPEALEMGAMALSGRSTATRSASGLRR